MVVRAAVCGASGYAGAEILRLLAGHPTIDVVAATAESNAGKAVADLFPSLRTAYPKLVCGPLDPGALAGLDLVFLALPHGSSQRIAAQLVDTVRHVIDLGADFRVPPSDYIEWYGEEHCAPELFDRFVYGIPELYREQLRTARHVAVAGCYPTAVSLACAPLVDAGIMGSPVVANAVSGLSGAGRAAKVASLFAEADNTVVAYGLLHHRHTVEMQRNLGAIAGRDVPVLFTPHLVPMTRGIHATCTAPLVADASDLDVLEVLRTFYAGEPFVVVDDEPPATKATWGSNAVRVSARIDTRTGTVLALGVLDNLVKGAAGQAVQCANLALGLDEATGLTAVGVMP